MRQLSIAALSDPWCSVDTVLRAGFRFPRNRRFCYTASALANKVLGFRRQSERSGRHLVYLRENSPELPVASAILSTTGSRNAEAKFPKIHVTPTGPRG
jgi:hypothetical protein